jgi:hypothetical protein
MRLTELEPRFVRYEKRADGVYHVETTNIRKAQGVQFLCPKCFTENAGPVGTHLVLCWSRSRGVPDDATPGPGRWTLEGTGFDDLTLNGDSKEGPGKGARSVLLTSGCGWHGFITNGEVT